MIKKSLLLIAVIIISSITIIEANAQTVMTSNLGNNKLIIDADRGNVIINGTSGAITLSSARLALLFEKQSPEPSTRHYLQQQDGVMPSQLDFLNGTNDTNSTTTDTNQQPQQQQLNDTTSSNNAIHTWSSPWNPFPQAPILHHLTPTHHQPVTPFNIPTKPPAK